MALITRTLKNADGTQQIAIFDTAQEPTDADLALYIDQTNGTEVITHPTVKSILILKGKLIFLENNLSTLANYPMHF
ncbi:hypothetical protein [Shewanella xiamenensis]|uniref:hypothetical protein n=1 Tax=Shewanella xiamenensis TaxID=332186 RepID=UPI00313BE012